MADGDGDKSDIITFACRSITYAWIPAKQTETHIGCPRVVESGCGYYRGGRACIRRASRAHGCLGASSALSCSSCTVGGKRRDEFRMNWTPSTKKRCVHLACTHRPQRISSNAHTKAQQDPALGGQKSLQGRLSRSEAGGRVLLDARFHGASIDPSSGREIVELIPWIVHGQTRQNNGKKKEAVTDEASAMHEVLPFCLSIDLFVPY